ncbi:MAG: ABC transporter substrate-binding protein [Sulfurovum sp.]|nr:ABC transporter substrate-binding protein [Sulfurovum sp.]
MKKLLITLTILLTIGITLKLTVLKGINMEVETFEKTSTLNNGKLDKIIIAGPMANVSHPVFRMMESGALASIANKVVFKLWKNPDQLKAMILNKEVDFVAVPTNVGAILYNKGQPIKLLNVSVWGILKILTRDKNIKSLEDLKGKELIVPWRGDMPDIILRAVLQKKGLSKDDIKITYVSNPMDAAKQLIMRKADNILLPEPATSMVLRKTKSFPVKLVAPTVFRGIDVQEEWGKAYKREAKIPQAGMAVIGDMLNNEKAIVLFEEAYGKAMDWYKANPKEAGELSAKYITMFTADAFTDSIGFTQLEVKHAIDVKDDIDFFFNVLKDDNPKTIGGKLPDDNFYIKD